MQPDQWSLYAKMLKSRLFEEAVKRLWEDGLISGEMHLSTGEEAIAAGLLTHLQEGDAMALDHRGTAPLIIRGVDPVLILRELLGREDGLCGGKAGHMHLASKEHLTAASGIVGAAGPTAAGFGLAAKNLRPGRVAVAFFGEGAMNQGMLMESMNLAATWNLPVLFVCKDDDWSITTESDQLTRGSLGDRARSLGLGTFKADGRDVQEVWRTAQKAVSLLRNGKGPQFLHLNCVHLEGHFLGFQLLRIIHNPFKELPSLVISLVRSLLNPHGAPLRERLAGLETVLSALLQAWRDPRRKPANDPIIRTREPLKADPKRLGALEASIKAEVNVIILTATQEMST